MHVACFKIALGTMKTKGKSVKRKLLDECDHIFYIAANTVNDNVAVTISTNDPVNTSYNTYDARICNKKLERKMVV
ncbi:hypothetical protein Tco_0781608 [Tanacetum coccineum]